MGWRWKKKYTILLGMTNKDDEAKKVSCEQAVSLVGNVCRHYNAPFSVTIQKGGYFYTNGRFVLEDSLAVSIIGLPRRRVKEIARDLCCFFCQECVMIVGSFVSASYISESIPLPEGAD